MPVQTRSQSGEKDRPEAKESKPPPSNPRPSQPSSDAIEVKKVTITYGNKTCSVDVNSDIQINHFLPQVVQHFTQNTKKSGGNPIDSFKFVDANDTPPSRDDQTLGEFLAEMNRRQPMNPPILRLKLLKNMTISIRDEKGDRVT